MSLCEFVAENGKKIEPRVFAIDGVITTYRPVTGQGEVTLKKDGQLSDTVISFHLASVFTADRFPRGPMAKDPVEVVFDLRKNDGLLFEVRRLRLPEADVATR